MGHLLDAATTLLGWVNHSAEPHKDERVIAPNTTVRLSTPLDAADAFTFVATHPGHSAAVTYTLEVAPELRDGTMGTWVQAAQVAVPASGGRVEAPINGTLLNVAAADAADVAGPCLVFARCRLTMPNPDPQAEEGALETDPAGAYAGLTH